MYDFFLNDCVIMENRKKTLKYFRKYFNNYRFLKTQKIQVIEPTMTVIFSNITSSYFADSIRVLKD